MRGCLLADFAFEEVSDIANRSITLFRDQGFAVWCPTTQVLMSVAGEQLFFRTATIAALPERQAGLATCRAVCDSFSIRCPDRRLVLTALIRQACQCMALKGERPDVCIIFSNVEDRLLAIRRDARSFESTRRDGKRLRIAVSVDPY